MKRDRTDLYEYSRTKKRGRTLNQFMKQAIELAIQNVQEGGQPFGAVLVKENEVVAKGVNELHHTHDVTGHAEILAIRRAQEKYQTSDLSTFTMYASGFPCPMCLTAMYYAGIKEAYYCQPTEEARKQGISTRDMYQELSKANVDRELTLKELPLEPTEKNPMALWKEQREAARGV